VSQPTQFGLLGLSLQELGEIVEKLGQPGYRAQQLFEAVYGQRVGAVQEITNLPQSFRQQLQEHGYGVGTPEVERSFTSADGTIRYLVRFADGESVETVWMPEGDDGETGDGSDAGDEADGSFASANRKPAGIKRGRATICVSSQVGCAVDCQFCMTALLGMTRNLTAGEIVGQVLCVLRDRGVAVEGQRVNLVFMGQGEPFLNYDNFIKAVGLLVEGVGIPASRMTVSTAGIVPRIYDLGQEAVRPKLAISLNAPNDEVRGRIMPINRKWNMEKLLAAARDFPLRNRERLTFEYVLLDGVNDAPGDARELLESIRGMRAKVNLIALNPGPEIPFGTPQDARVLAFQKVLTDAGVPAFIRRPRGRDIYAACGQLKKMAG
jgi:23S rRNA (adenine2503-C2)-methyltransferase